MKKLTHVYRDVYYMFAKFHDEICFDVSCTKK